MGYEELLGSMSLEYLKGAATDLLNAFCWEDSDEGYPYWSKVHQRLLEMVKEKENQVKESKEDQK